MSPTADRRLSGKVEPVESCLFCNSPFRDKASISAEDYFFNAVEGSFRFVSCRECGSLNLVDRLLPDYLLEAYGNYYTHASSGESLQTSPSPLGAGNVIRKLKRALCLPIEGRRYRNRIAEVPTSVGKEVHFRMIPPSVSRILDYGCGGGAFMRHVASQGHEVAGIDFDPDVLKDRHREGFQAQLPSEIPDGWHGYFDIVSMRHVIEHVPSPDDTLRIVRNCLRPGGWLFIETPHAQAEGLRVYGRYWRGLEAPRHLAIASLDGILRTLTRAGFADIQPYFRAGVRAGTWTQSDGVVPEGERAAMEVRRSMAAEETLDNSEYIDLWCRKL